MYSSLSSSLRLFSNYRTQCEFIEALLKAMAYVRSDNSITTTLDATPTYVKNNIWQKYVEFQAEYNTRLDLLRTEKREVPVVDGTDRNMPAILHTWTGKFSRTQPPRNYKSDPSCAFDEKRISEYERHNTAFQDNIKKAAPVAASKMIALMIMDLAFLKSFDVEWEASHAALETAGGAASDDDVMDIDVSSWDVTDPDSVPWKDLKVPARGKLPTHIAYAAAILGLPDKCSKEVQSFINQTVLRMRALSEEYNTDDWTQLMTRGRIFNLRYLILEFFATFQNPSPRFSSGGMPPMSGGMPLLP